jgi:hypothetical protein
LTAALVDEAFFFAPDNAGAIPPAVAPDPLSYAPWHIWQLPA